MKRIYDNNTNAPELFHWFYHLFDGYSFFLFVLLKTSIMKNEYGSVKNEKVLRLLRVRLASRGFDEYVRNRER